jgi:plasmid stabilization system protein ParE
VSQPLPINFTLRASRQVTEAGIWWREHRSKAPDALHEELQQGLQLIASQPEIGAIARNVKLAGVRRILLRRVGYHVYYRRVHSPDASIQVVAFWHASRGDAPRL